MKGGIQWRQKQIEIGRGGLDLSEILDKQKKNFCYSYVELCKKNGGLAPPPPSPGSYAYGIHVLVPLDKLFQYNMCI